MVFAFCEIAMTKPKFFTISEVLTPAFVRFNLDILYNENIAALGLFLLAIRSLSSTQIASTVHSSLRKKRHMKSFRNSFTDEDFNCERICTL